MSLNEQEVRVLDCIADGRTSSDPRLGSLLMTFSQLASGQEMPVHEKIGTNRRHRRPSRRSRSGHAGRRLRPGSHRAGTLRAVLLWVVLSAGLIAVALIIIPSGPRTCVESRAATCTLVQMSGTEHYRLMP